MLYNNQPKGFLVGRVVIVVMSVDMLFFCMRSYKEHMEL